MPHASFATTTRGLDRSRPPFGLAEGDSSSYAMTQCSRRFERLEVARGATLEEVAASTREVVDRDDGCEDQDRIT